MPEQIDSPVSAAFEVDEAKRTIRGLAVPYGAVATAGGQKWTFSKGTVRVPEDVSRVKVLVGHDFGKAVGVATELDDREDGLYMTARIAKGAAGDEVLSMAAEGVWDGLSIGLGQGGKFRTQGGVNHALEAPLMEVSVTPMPSFTDARVQAVAASATNGGNMDENENTTTEGLDFSAITDAIQQGFESLRVPQREPVSAGAPLEVHEPTPYRFDGIAGQHSFVDDMRDAQQGDSGARERLAAFSEEFQGAMFAVTTGNAAATMPTQNRPDLYVPNLTFSRPLWELVSNGVVNDRTPFTVPKFGSASGLAGAHSEGVEPIPGAFAASAQTVNPSPISGKIEINREVLDAGGSPQVDQIIWGEMQNAYFEAIEAKIAQTLNAVATAEQNLGAAVDAALVNSITNYLAGLQFVRGGNRFTAFAADDRLFPKLVSAADSTGRKLLPVLGATNAQGQTSGGFDRVQVGNTTVRAAWALATALGTNHRSFNFVPSSVWAWASAPKRFEFQYQVKSVDLAVWGYSAAAVLRDSDVQPIDYDVAD